ncbi:hypothetical protein [Cellulomonas xiejunii]|uniref:Uncharacterized protein n=1 Tax=Cellulomonas xiejunii TaxID=2968083 RepID=A0ABY5KR39_9CELL|nr:hypothetical protein [Cellulomonas xiejunii]MCC2322274.1 hypothetical protein [Cellulomonas xiejunii]UUI72328.1 hypothetical protein NP048_02335 [Cellulomonas xiejunii]
MSRGPERRRRRAGLNDRLDPSPAGDGGQWSSPIRDGEWLDAYGARWRRRGGLCTDKRVRRLLGSPEVRVLLFYGPHGPTEVEPADRDALWQRMCRYLKEPAVRDPGDCTDFDAGEFRDDQRRTLLVIEESC